MPRSSLTQASHSMSVHFQLFQGILLDLPASFYTLSLGKHHLHVLGFHFLEKSLVCEITCSGIGQPEDPAQSVCPRAFFIAVI